MVPMTGAGRIVGGVVSIVGIGTLTLFSSLITVESAVAASTGESVVARAFARIAGPRFKLGVTKWRLNSARESMLRLPRRCA
jgi:hypothetical protein